MQCHVFVSKKLTLEAQCGRPGSGHAEFRVVPGTQPRACSCRATKRGNLPLHTALTYRATVETVQMLLDYYPEATSCRNRRGRLPIHSALKYRALNVVVNILLERDPETIRIPDNSGMLPLQCACHFTGDEPRLQRPFGVIRRLCVLVSWLCLAPKHQDWPSVCMFKHLKCTSLSIALLLSTDLPLFFSCRCRVPVLW